MKLVRGTYYSLLPRRSLYRAQPLPVRQTRTRGPGRSMYPVDSTSPLATRSSSSSRVSGSASRSIMKRGPATSLPIALSSSFSASVTSCYRSRTARGLPAFDVNPRSGCFGRRAEQASLDFVSLVVHARPHFSCVESRPPPGAQGWQAGSSRNRRGAGNRVSTTPG